MPMEKQKKLVMLLLQKTNNGELDWRPALREGAFQVSFKENSLRIASKEIGFEQEDYEIDLINDEGQTVDSFSDSDLDRDRPTSSALTWYPKMRELYELARRTALGSEKILNEIITELEEDLPF